MSDLYPGTITRAPLTTGDTLGVVFSWNGSAQQANTPWWHDRFGTSPEVGDPCMVEVPARGLPVIVSWSGSGTGGGGSGMDGGTP